MLGTEAHADEASWNSSQQWVSVEEADGAWNLDRTLRLQRPHEDRVLQDHLHPLRDSGWKLSAPLNRLQLGGGRDAALQRLVQQVRRRHGILNGEVDADAADGRHRVRRVADAKQARPVPLTKTIDENRQ